MYPHNLHRYRKRRRKRPYKAHHQALGVAAVAALLSGTACRHVDPPEPPDLSATIAAYSGPTASLDVDLAEEVGRRLVSHSTKVEVARGLPVLQVILETLQPSSSMDAGTPVDAGMQGVPPSDVGLELHEEDPRFRGNGYLTITAPCPGWDDDDESGSLELTLLVVDSKIFEVVWGAAQRCRFGSAGTNLEVDGEVFVALDRALSFEDIDPGHLTVHVNIEAATQDVPTPTAIDFDFRAFADGRLEFRIVGREGGHIIARLSRNRWEVVATNGTFACDFDIRRCTRSDTGEFITW